jgi:hypothetical protein
MPKKNNSTNHNEENQPQESEVSLVPLYSPLDVTKGIQAYRRGDMILYTIKGEPEKVQELIGELNNTGVDELVAFVSHRSDRDIQDVADAIVKDEVEKAEKGPEKKSNKG